MTFRRLAILLLLLAAGAMGGIAMRGQPPQVMEANAAPAPPPPPPTVRVLTAGRALPHGALLNEQHVEIVEMSAVPEGFLPRDDLLHPGERGFLAAVLRPNHRAISIGVDAVTGAGGLVAPGDLVDLVLVQNFDASDAPVARRVTAETVLTRLRVIAIDQQIQQGGQTTNVVGQARVARTVTLEVSPEQAEMVAVAEQLGRLALTVRPALDEPQEVRAALPVFGGDVSSALGSSAIPTPARMRVIQGNDSAEVTFR
jgi:pilus assembly protein CpaB